MNKNIEHDEPCVECKGRGKIPYVIKEELEAFLRSPNSSDRIERWRDCHVCYGRGYITIMTRLIQMEGLLNDEG